MITCCSRPLPVTCLNELPKLRSIHYQDPSWTAHLMRTLRKKLIFHRHYVDCLNHQFDVVSRCKLEVLDRFRGENRRHFMRYGDIEFAQ